MSTCCTHNTSALCASRKLSLSRIYCTYGCPRSAALGGRQQPENETNFPCNRVLQPTNDSVNEKDLLWFIRRWQE